MEEVEEEEEEEEVLPSAYWHAFCYRLCVSSPGLRNCRTRRRRGNDCSQLCLSAGRQAGTCTGRKLLNKYSLHHLWGFRAGC
jgi:hypothetical protein